MPSFSAHEISRVLGRLESQMIHVNAALGEIKTSMDELKNRVHHLERQYYLWRGGVSTMVAIGTLIGSACDLFVRWLYQ